MLVILVLGISISVVLFFGIKVGIDEYIQNDFLSPENIQERRDGYYESLQEYITEKNITADDASRISGWEREHEYVYVLIEKGSTVLYESGREITSSDGTSPPDTDEDGETGSDTSKVSTGASADFMVQLPTQEQLCMDAKAMGYKTMTDADGAELFVYILGYREFSYYNASVVISLVVAIGAFFVTMWVYFYSIVHRITKLGKEVNIVADGDVVHPIAVGGDDEIARLSADIEHMRNTMLENIKKERAALEANRELITAMSHDIRTPLTVLLGYLDIMKQSRIDDSMRGYVEASEKTALRLKKMSDDMFGYFLAFGGSIDVEFGEYDARTLIDQLFAGHIFLLREQGYNVAYNFENEGIDYLGKVLVYTDPSLLMRIVENIFSNLLKYADKGKEINVEIMCDTDEMTIKVVNGVVDDPDESQKNGIGLKSCMKIASAMDVRFSVFEADRQYESVLCVPIIPDIEYGDDDEYDEESEIFKNIKKLAERSKNMLSALWQKIKGLFKRKNGKNGSGDLKDE